MGGELNAGAASAVKAVEAAAAGAAGDLAEADSLLEAAQFERGKANAVRERERKTHRTHTHTAIPFFVFLRRRER